MSKIPPQPGRSHCGTHGAGTSVPAWVGCPKQGCAFRVAQTITIPVTHSWHHTCLGQEAREEIVLTPQRRRTLGVKRASVSSAVRWAWGGRGLNETTLKGFPVFLLLGALREWLIQPERCLTLEPQGRPGPAFGEWETRARRRAEAPHSHH